MEQIEIIRPDDWHVHFRDGKILQAVVPETSRHFARSIVMPNLIPPVLNARQAIEYKNEIEKAIPKADNFQPLMTIYLTERTIKNEVKDAYNNGSVFAVKLYPAGATTNSDSGVITSNSTFGTGDNAFTTDSYTAILVTGDENFEWCGASPYELLQYNTVNNYKL